MRRCLLILAFLTGILSVSARDTFSHDIQILPVAAQTTIKNNFKAEISHIKIEKDLGRVSEYDVVLTDGTEITFDRSGNWKDIEVRKSGSVPTVLIPESITSYISRYQKHTTIIGIERKKSGYEVELSNGVEMKFNSDGKFLKYDN